MTTQVSTGVYDLDYFGSAATFLYIGDVWIDEITSLQYVCQQEKTPLYGYASQLFDTTAAGRVLVTGSFSINFKEQGYLWAVLRRYFQINADITGFSSEYDGNLTSNKLPITKSSQSTEMMRSTIERLVDGKITKSEQYKFYNDIAGYLTVGDNATKKKDSIFESIMNTFEDEIWQSDSKTLNSQTRRTDDNKFDGFDIYCIWGNYANPAANRTVQKISGVRLLSQGKRIMIGPEPIGEEYSFLAQSVQ